MGKRVITKVSLQEPERMGGSQAEEPKTTWFANAELAFYEGVAGIDVMRAGVKVKTIPFASLRSYEWGEG